MTKENVPKRGEPAQRTVSRPGTVDVKGKRVRLVQELSIKRSGAEPGKIR